MATEKKNNKFCELSNYVKLVAACSEGNLELVKSLFEKEEYDDINDLNETLSCACESSDNIEVILFLLEKGINPNYGIKEVYTSGNLKLLKLLIEKGANEFNDDIEYVFNCNHHINLEDNFEHNCYCEHMEIIKFFVEKGIILEIIESENIVIYLKYIFWKHIIFRNIEKRQVFIIKKLPDDILYKITEYL